MPNFFFRNASPPLLHSLSDILPLVRLSLSWALLRPTFATLHVLECGSQACIAICTVMCLDLSGLVGSGGLEFDGGLNESVSLFLLRLRSIS